MTDRWPTRIPGPALGAGAMLALLVVTVAAFPLPRPPGPADGDGGHPSVDLEEVVGRFVAAQPARSGYRVPTHDERDRLTAGVAALLDGDVERGRDLAEAAGYEVRTVVDTRTGRRCLDLYDRSERRGWGRLIIDLSRRPLRLGVQVPHPGADIATELSGVDLFRRVPGSVLMVAGANRRAGNGNEADVAHRTDSVFHSVSELLLSRGLPLVQLHGFHDASLPGTQIVISSGAAAPGRLVRQTATTLDAELRVCRAWAEPCGQLEARTNAQGQAAAAAGGTFVHVEMSRTVRESAALWQDVTAAIAEAVLTPAAGRT